MFDNIEVSGAYCGKWKDGSVITRQPRTVMYDRETGMEYAFDFFYGDCFQRGESDLGIAQNETIMFQKIRGCHRIPNKWDSCGSYLGSTYSN